MNTLTVYLVLLLSGIIIGGMIVAMVLLPVASTRRLGYRPPIYPEDYEYGAYPARRPTALPATLLFLLLLLALLLLAHQRGQELQVGQPDRVEQTAPPGGVDGLYKP
ncbi:MAG: hypothetical protein H6556_17980 [Lewinellaceae bacterium]|nr:hypothetical protein [Lewinellaceae bacterium]